MNIHVLTVLGQSTMSEWTRQPSNRNPHQEPREVAATLNLLNLNIRYTTKGRDQNKTQALPINFVSHAWSYCRVVLSK